MSILKSVVQGAIREYVEKHGDLHLRLSVLTGFRVLLDDLEAEAKRELVVLDFPLWFMGENTSSSNAGFFLLREDVDPDVIVWISNNFLGRCSGWGVRPEDVHPEYPCFAKTPILIGNKVSPPKAYLYASHLNGFGSAASKAIEARLGAPWKGYPRDVEGNVVRRW